MPLTVRAATVADVPLITDFNARLAQETEGKTLDPAIVTAGVIAALTDPHKGPYYLAVDGATVMGQLQITFEWSDWRNGWLWWIQGVYVPSAARRHGVFRALYDHVYRLAKADGGVIGLRLYVEKDNVAAQATYRQMGMEPAGYLLFERFPL
jgi:ribosomal protein S18 acetylase RimI-like enzyme